MSTTSSAASSAALEALLGFCAAHPVQDTDAPRFLKHLNSGPRAIIDWRDRGVVAVLLDTIIGEGGVVRFELVGLGDGALTPVLAVALLSELAERAPALGTAATEIAVTPIWAAHRPAIEAAGYRLYYTDCDMVCRDPDWGADHPLPPGSRWADAAPDWVDEYIRVLQSGFAGVPGAFVPPAEEVRRYLVKSGIRARILIENGMAAAVLRYTEPENYINAVVRSAGQKGRGLGRLIMDEARRCLVTHGNNKGPMRLTVVDTNTAAIELYRRCHFEIEKEVPVLVRRF